MNVDLKQVEEACKELYIRALKLLPPDIKEGFKRLDENETDKTGKAILGTMIRNISVAEENQNLLCQDTGIPIYNVTIGSGVEVDGYALKQAIKRGCERATTEHPLRSSVVHPTTRKNQHTSSGRLVPVINIDFVQDADTLTIEMIPKGSGSENNSWLKMAIPAEGIDAIKTFVVDCVLDAGGHLKAFERQDGSADAADGRRRIEGGADLVVEEACPADGESRHHPAELFSHPARAHRAARPLYGQRARSPDFGAFRRSTAEVRQSHAQGLQARAPSLQARHGGWLER